MFIKRLKQKKKKSNFSFFKRQVVEYYRADILSAQELAKELQISSTLLRYWNRWYFKIRLLRHFKSKMHFAMKNKDQQIEKLKADLAQAYKENAQLKLKNEALQIMIHLAEDKFNVPIEKKSGSKQSQK
jgi:hypothetical protein